MIAALRFSTPRASGGRVVREARFVRRSGLPLSAACLVANGVREHLSSSLGRAFETSVIDPVVLDQRAARALFSGATVYRVRGRLCDAFTVLRSDDALRLAALAFGETERAEGEMSPVERLTLDRLLALLPPLCVPLCGEVRSVATETPERASAESAAYFEVRLSPVAVAFGFAMSIDPSEVAVPALALEDLRDLEMECTVECARGTIDVDALARLSAGETLALQTPLGGGGTLCVSGVPIAYGTCGARGERAAFAIA